MKNDFLKFPKDFFWGASTSAHQVEGGQHNDWTAWEKQNAHRLASGAKRYWERRSPVWSEIEAEATSPANYISGTGSDHWHRYHEDFDLAQSIGLNAYRMSIEWSRIEPEPGKFDHEAIEHYRAMIKAVKARGMEPFVTIWHWPLPQWLAKRGGWTYNEISHYYITYTALLVREFGDEVKYWVTFNEPNVFSENAYFTGSWPPQRRSLRAFYLAVSNMIKAHREAYHIIKSLAPDVQVGVCINFIPYQAYRNLWVNRLLQRYADFRWNWTFLYRVRKHLDFVGVNHYFGYRINYGFNKPNVALRSDLGWELYPEAMFQTLMAVRRYKLPIYITESGLADRDDRYRGWFIRETLKQVHRAMRHNVDVRGYFHWSLLDNFEWDKGYWPRFGLIAVDYKHDAKRQLRPSAHEYARIIERNGVDDV